MKNSSRHTLFAIIAIIGIAIAGYFYINQRVDEIVQQKWQDELRTEVIDSVIDCKNDSINALDYAVR